MNLGVLKLIFIFLISINSFIIEAKPIEGILVKIQILDKITAKVETFEIEVNNSLKFQSLNIEVYTCYKNPPEQIPEDYVLLRIFDQINKVEEQLVYQGWMIASSPASSPMEHPIYDLWLKECRTEIDF